MSLQSDINVAFHSVADASKRALDEMATEAGYTDTLRDKWTKQMEEAHTDNAAKPRQRDEAIRMSGGSQDTWHLMALATSEVGCLIAVA